MKISIVGSRGIPNKYGGFEQFAEYFSKFLANKNFNVTVYNTHEHKVTNNTYKGVKIVNKWCPEKYLGPIAHIVYDYLCLKDAINSKSDIVLALGYHSNALSYLILDCSKINIISNMDGMEWKRSKWNFLTKLFIKFTERIAVKSSNLLISDNEGIREYFLKNYNKDSVMIPYGASIFHDEERNILKEFKLKKLKYSIVIARIEPENNIESIIKGFKNYKNRDEKLIIVGPKNSFSKKLYKKYKSNNIIFFGGIYNLQKLNHLRKNAKFYFHGHSVGGTNPSLLEAMSSSALIVAHDNIFNKNILNNDALYFKNSNDIEKILSYDQNELNRSEIIQNNLKKIKNIYDWEIINKKYLETINKVYLNDYKK